MKNKMIIAIITVLICISAIVGAVQHFGNDKKENSNLISTDASAEHTTAEEETSLSAVLQEVQHTSALSESESESNSQEKVLLFRPRQAEQQEQRQKKQKQQNSKQPQHLTQ